MKKVLFLLIVVVLFLLGGIAYLYYQRAKIITYFAIQELEKSGFQNVIIESPSPGLNKLLVKRFSAGRKHSAFNLELDLSEIAIGYSLDSIKAGRIFSLEIGTAEILYIKHDGESSTAQAELKLPLRDEIPLDVLKIRDASLDLSGHGLDPIHFSGAFIFVSEADVMTALLRITKANLPANFNEIVATASLSGSGSSAALHGKLSVDALKVKDSNLPRSDWDLDYTFKPPVFRLKGSSTIADSTPLKVDVVGEYLLDSKGGTFTFDVKDTPLAKHLEFIRRVARVPNLPIDFPEGTVSVHSKLTLKSNILSTAEVAVDINNCSGVVGPATFSGFSGRHEFSLLPSFRSVSQSKIKFKKITDALDLTDVTSSVQVQPEAKGGLRLEVSDAHGEILGGKIQIKRFTFIPGRKENNFLLEFSGLDLKELLALHPQEAVRGSGILDGSLPVTVSAQGVQIARGEFKARPPGGIIQYQSDDPKAFSAGNAQLEQAFRALENFYYEALSGEMTLKRSGDLLILTKIQGKNPDMNSSRPVHVNLTLEENVPALLKSIKLASDTTSAIEGRLHGKGVKGK